MFNLFSGLDEGLHASLEAVGALRESLLLGSNAHTFFLKEEVGIELQPEQYWRCTKG